MKQTKKICWKRLLKKAIEDGIKKAIELLILAIILGATLKLVLVTVPAVTVGAILAKAIKIKVFDV